MWLFFPEPKILEMNGRPVGSGRPEPAGRRRRAVRRAVLAVSTDWRHEVNAQRGRTRLNVLTFFLDVSSGTGLLEISTMLISIKQPESEVMEAN